MHRHKFAVLAIFAILMHTNQTKSDYEDLLKSKAQKYRSDRQIVLPFYASSSGTPAHKFSGGHETESLRKAYRSQHSLSSPGVNQTGIESYRQSYQSFSTRHQNNRDAILRSQQGGVSFSDISKKLRTR